MSAVPPRRSAAADVVATSAGPAAAAYGPQGSAPDRLLASLGFRAPRADELERTLARASSGEPTLPTIAPRVLLPVTLLNADPLISYSGLARDTPLGFAGALSGIEGPTRGWFLLSPTWSIDEAATAARLRGLAVHHRRKSPGHRLIFVCNTPQEVARMQQEGEAALFFNKTASVRENIFRPLGSMTRDLDAIYTAQLVPWKRHELSLAIPRCGFLFYRDGGDPTAAASEIAIRERHARLAPGHEFINQLDQNGRPERLLPDAVNRQLSRARVGLCLSEREGAMFASMEYLLAGLPVVTTPSEGGRDGYFDDAYCLTVPPDPASVAEAVAALAARDIPASHIRAETLKRVNARRRRFLELLDDIVAAEGRRRKFGRRWRFDQPVMMHWYPAERAIARAVDGRVDAYTRRRLRYWTAALARAVRRRAR
jgi:hypothetical protein